MLRVGVFSDDVGGPVAAMLLARGLADPGDGVTLATPGWPELMERRQGDVDPSPVSLLSLREGDEGRGLAEADFGGRDLVVSLGLSALRDGQVSSRLDVRIVVGKDHPAASRALRAARCEPGRTGVTPWFLAFANQSVLRTQASLVSGGGVPLPFCARALPTALPRLDRSLEIRLLRGEHPEECRRTGILLAALAMAASAMPDATRIEAGDLGTLMASPASAGERLLRLAGAFERVAPGNEPQAARRPVTTARRQDARHRHPSQVGSNQADGRLPTARSLRTF